MVKLKDYRWDLFHGPDNAVIAEPVGHSYGLTVSEVKVLMIKHHMETAVKLLAMDDDTFLRSQGYHETE